MDGEAICSALASTPGPDSLRDLPKLGLWLKVYHVTTSALYQQYREQVSASAAFKKVLLTTDVYQLDFPHY